MGEKTKWPHLRMFGSLNIFVEKIPHTTAKVMPSSTFVFYVESDNLYVCLNKSKFFTNILSAACFQYNYKMLNLLLTSLSENGLLKD